MIEPAIVSLGPGESVAFSTDGETWPCVPKIGKFHRDIRVYEAPRWIFNSHTVLITASTPGKPAAGGTAEIRLNSSAFWLTALSVYWPALLLVLAAAAWRTWPALPAQPVLIVHPPAVTLSSGQNQQFSASLNDEPTQDITWSATAGAITQGGFYSAPDKVSAEQTVTITATRNSDKTKSASATAIVSPGPSLFLYPALSHVQKAGRVALTAQGGDAILWPRDAPKGVYMAPDKIPQRQFVTISVADLKHAGHVAGARIVLLPDAEGAASAPAVPSDTTLMTLAVLAGALGAWLACVKSFVAYTGTRSFVPSWGLFYLSRPTFGAGLALIVHLAHRMGSVGTAGTAGNPAVVAFYSALVGLFADEALQKLHDIFCTVFGVQDKRTDKMGKGTAAAPAPAITSAVASASKKEIAIEGDSFVAASTVLVDNVARPVSFVSDKKLVVKLDTLPAVSKEITLKVKNPDGGESAPYKATVVS